MRFQSSWWLRGGHLQTIWAARVAARMTAQKNHFFRERWASPDQDFIDVDWLIHEPKKVAVSDCGEPSPLLVLFHGLEGSSSSHYANAFAHHCFQDDVNLAIPHFRGCSGEINLQARSYHSGDWMEIDWILEKFKRCHGGPVLAAGISLGGNALVRWAGEKGVDAASKVAAIASISAPLDLAACGHALGQGVNRYLYTPVFLKTLIPKALQKIEQHPHLINHDAIDKLKKVTTLYEFDDIYTAPVHGFSSAADYWQQASAKPYLNCLKVPTLLLNARNDPFVPSASLPKLADCSAFVQLWQPRLGGHVGFSHGTLAQKLQQMPQQVVAWLKAAALFK